MLTNEWSYTGSVLHAFIAWTGTYLVFYALLSTKIKIPLLSYIYNAEKLSVNTFSVNIAR
jgi:hypothetical protein